MGKGLFFLFFYAGLCACGQHDQQGEKPSVSDTVQHPSSLPQTPPQTPPVTPKGLGNEYWSGGSKRDDIKLPDGTQVIMHEGTIIRLVKGFSAAKRELWVQGDAMFTIGAGGPFVIHTAFLRIEAAAGKFRVEAKAREAGEEVDLVKGALKVMKSYHSDTDNEPEQLKTGDMVMINHDIDLMEKEKMDGSELKGW